MLGVETVLRMRAGHLVQHYLMASYCYYQCDESPMTDAAYDLLCKRLHENWRAAQSHQHAHLIDVHQLEAGTGFYIGIENYPWIVVSSSDAYLQKAISGQLARDLEPHLLPRVGSAPNRIRRTVPVPVAPAAPVVKRVSRRTT